MEYLSLFVLPSEWVVLVLTFCMARCQCISVELVFLGFVKIYRVIEFRILRCN
jgi:hypothetical protein